MSDLFEGAELNGKRFPFVHITISSQAKIMRKFFPTLRDVMLKRLRPETQLLRHWKKLRSVAFVKSGSWKWMGIIPHELRIDVIKPEEVKKIDADFFRYCGLTLLVSKEQSDSQKATETKTQTQS
jgi:hypothetical protein